MFGSYNVLREIYIHLNCGVNVILADNVNVRLDPVNFDLQKTSFPLTCLAFFLLNQIQTNVIVTGNRTVERPNVLTLPGAMFANANLDISSTKFRKPVKVCNYG